jgi:hypothetical protein
MFRTMRETFWILALALILLFAFFLALGAFDPRDMKGVTAGVLALFVAWIVHGLVGSRSRGAGRDELAIRARERRGF